jgi:hypothetical protein
MAGRQRVIEEHFQKIAEERAKPTPNQYLISYWEKEIRHRRREIERLRKRLDN